ncbi:MAG TPA: TonB-dependent receptor [Steroidobacteraceae bacterium]|nr:TonB-dependent receptor [Steroidobacteraceae bacterium]
MSDDTRAPAAAGGFCLNLTLAALAATLAAGGAAAQSSNPAALTAPSAEGAESAGAADSGGLQEVVVTARRREENLQDVPIAVSAVSGATLIERNVTNLQDLNSFAPNFKISPDRATNNTINVYIRGVGQSDPLWGFEPGVGVYLDDVYLARPQSALLDVYDVDHIEILRGPQGTLYGKNTIAGAIKYVSRDIVGPTTASATVIAGNYGELDEKLSFSTPIVAEHVYFGAAAANFKRDGFGQVVESTSPYNYDGQDVSNKDVLSARGTLAFLWGASSKLRLQIFTIQDNSHAPGGQRLNDFIAPALDSRYNTRTDMPVNEDRYIRNGESATYTQDLASNLALKVVGAYIEGDGRQFIDFEELNANLFQVPGHFSDHQGSGEAQLTWTTDLVKAVGGLFYMDSTACGQYDASIGVLAPPPPAGFGLYLTSLTSGCVKTKTKAVYADTTWKLTDKLNFDAGLRWNQDDKTANVYVAQYASVAPTQLLPNQTFFDPNNVPAGFFPFGGGLNGVPGLESDYSNSRTFPNVSPRVGFDMHFTPHVLGYLIYSRGFKSGGFDMRGNQLAYPATTNGYDSETADNYEAGIKSTLLDDTLLLNFTLFYNPYNDAQIGIQGFENVGGVPTNVTAVLNAGKQINQGAELESTWRPLPPLSFIANVGYLDSYYEHIKGCIPGSQFPPGVPCDPNLDVAHLNHPINAPLWTISLATSYTWSLWSGSLMARADWDYRTFNKVANTTASVTDQPAYGVFNAGLSWSSRSGAWRFAIDGKNLFDRWYRVAGYDFGDPGTGLVGGVSQIGFYGPPRQYSFTATYRF